jgi:hypothetical protein
MDVDDSIFNTRNDADELGDLWPNLGLRSSTPIPPLLHTCQESRSVASKSYTLSFATLGSKAQTYINFELDTLYLSVSGFLYEDSHSLHLIGVLRHFCSEERSKIQNLALDARMMKAKTDEDPSFDSPWLCHVLSFFGNVKKVILVVQEYKSEPSKKRTGPYERSADQIFLEPVDIDRRRYMFEHPRYHLKHENIPALKRALFPTIDDDDFAAIRELNIEEGEPAWLKPILEHKILTTSTVKGNLEHLQQHYESTPGCRCYDHETIWTDELFLR